MKRTKTIALVAHDNRKPDLTEWVEWNYRTLLKHRIVCTGTTGRMIDEAIQRKLKDEDAQSDDSSGQHPTMKILKLKSGPLGGDQQMGALIAEQKIDMIIFFWDPMQPQPHDVDVKALLRIAVLYNVPTACNRSTADFMISSPLMSEPYEPKLVDYTSYINRIL